MRGFLLETARLFPPVSNVAVWYTEAVNTEEEARNQPSIPSSSSSSPSPLPSPSQRTVLALGSAHRDGIAFGRSPDAFRIREPEWYEAPWGGWQEGEQEGGKESTGEEEKWTGGKGTVKAKEKGAQPLLLPRLGAFGEWAGKHSCPARELGISLASGFVGAVLRRGFRVIDGGDCLGGGGGATFTGYKTAKFSVQLLAGTG